MKPCRACVARGQESECEYITNNEDRFQISQNEVIGRLRKEVNRLKRRLTDVETSSPSSESGIYERHPYSRKTLKRAISDHGGSSLMHMADVHPFDSSSWSVLPTRTIFQYNDTAGRPTASASGGNQSRESVHIEREQHLFLPTAKDYQGTCANLMNLRWPSLIGFAILTRRIASSMTSSFSGSSSSQTSFSNQQERLLTDELLAALQIPPGSVQIFSSEEGSSVGGLDNRQLNQWKGKQDLLQYILNTICDIDESRVPVIIDIIRRSPSPEEAIVFIQQAMSSNSPVPIGPSRLDFAFAPFIPSSLSVLSYTEGPYPAPPSLGPSSTLDQQWSGELSRDFLIESPQKFSKSHE
jgi:hypothetical protein